MYFIEPRNKDHALIALIIPVFCIFIPLDKISIKIVNGKIAVNILEYIVGPTRVTRSYHISNFINIGSNNNTSKYNFFTRTLKEGNTLPSFLLDQPSVEAFKSAVTNYFSLSH